ncbi:MAG: ABC transporter permease subunit [Planctomycetota bacterium]
MQRRENKTDRAGLIRLAYWESLIALRSGGVRVTLAVFGLLLTIAIILGVVRTQTRQNDSQMAEKENHLVKEIFRDALQGTLDSSGDAEEPSTRQSRLTMQLRMTARSPYMVSHSTNLWNFSLYPSPLSALSVGASNKWPDLYRIYGLSLSSTLERSDRIRPVASVYGPFDVTFVVMTIAPLVVIGLTFNASSGDRESTLQSLVVAQTPSPGNLIAIRCFVRAGLVIGLQACIVNGGLLIAFSNQFASDIVVNLAVWNAVAALYLFTWAGLSLFVNSFAKSSSANGTAMLLLWLILVLLIPRAVSSAVENAVPTLPESELVALEKNTIDQATENIDEVVRRFQDENPGIELRPDDQQQMALVEYLLAHDEAGGMAVENTLAHYSGQTMRANYLAFCNWISPAISFRNQSDRCSGNSEQNFVDFTVRAAETQAGVVKVFLKPSITNEECSVETIAELPRLQDSESSRRPLFPSSLQPIAAMLLWLAVLVITGTKRFRVRD